MAHVVESAKKAAIKKSIDLALNHADKNRETGITDIVNVIQKFMPVQENDKEFNSGTNAFDGIKERIGNKNSKWYKYTNTILDDIDRNVLSTSIMNLAYTAGYKGLDQARTNRIKYNCNIPWVILFDPTSACNLRCKGCWASEYGYKLNLSNDDMEKIVSEGKALGSYMYIMTGGEPTVRLKDIMNLAEKHHDCYFHLFTNGTLITEEDCKRIQKLGNISFAISLEGAEDVNDARRGEGIYQKVLATMDLLKKYGILFGVSACYTSQNYESIVSPWYIDLITSHGAKLIWYFHYMPVGNNAVPELLPNPDQREYVFRRIREMREDDNEEMIMPIDFQGDAQYVNGCIAGGKNYLHINSNGDVEPCVFIHYSSANIKDPDTSLLDALQQPLFMQYHDNMPFNKNMLQPCPMLENSGKLSEMVEATNAHSTDLESPESAKEIESKTTQYAKNWAPRADKLAKEFNTYSKTYESSIKLRDERNAAAKEK